MKTTQNDKHQEPSGKLSNQSETQEKAKKEFDPNKTTAQKDQQNRTMQNNQEPREKTKVPVKKQWDIK